MAISFLVSGKSRFLTPNIQNIFILLCCQTRDSLSVFVMTLYGLNLDSAIKTRIRAISIWRNARGRKNGIHQPELTAVKSGENPLIQHLLKWGKNPLEPPQIRVFQERVKKSVHFWCNFWDTKRAASVCFSTTCGFLSAVRGGF